MTTKTDLFRKGLALCLISLLFYLPKIAASGDVKVWKTYREEAMQALKRRDLVQAEAGYLKAIQEAEKFGETDRRLAESLFEAASFYLKTRRYAEAEKLSQRAVSLRENAVSLNRHDLPMLIVQLAEIYMYGGKLNAAEETYLRAKKLAEPVFGKFHPLSGEIKAGMGRVALHRKDAEKAITYFKEALAIAENPMSQTVVEKDSIVIYEREADERKVAQLLNDLGLAYKAGGKADDAEKSFLKAVKKLEKNLGANTPDLSSPLFNLIQLYLDQKKTDETQRLLKRITQIAKENTPPEHPIWRDLERINLKLLQQTNPQEAVKKLNDMADRFSDEGQFKLIPALYDQIAEIEGFEKDSQPLVRVCHQLGALYLEDRKLDLAELWERRALKIGKKAFVSDELALTAVYESLAEICAQREKLEEAETLYRTTLVLQEKKYGKESAAVAKTLERLASVLNKKGNAAESELFLERMKKTRNRNVQ